MNHAAALQNGAASSMQMVAPDYRVPPNPAQLTQFGQPPAQTGANWTLPTTDQAGDQISSQAVDRDNFSLQAVAVPPEATRAPVEMASGTLQPGAATEAAGDSGERMGEKNRALVLDRRITPPTPQVEQKSNGWRPAVTPLPAALVQGQPTARPASDGSSVFTSNGPVAAQANGTQANTAPADIAQPAVANPSLPIQPMELARRGANDSATESPNLSLKPLPDMPPPSRGPAKSPAARLDQEPVAFTSPATANERPLPPAPPAEPAGVVALPSQVPPTLSLTPRSVPRTASLHPEQDVTNSILDREAQLAKQTDDIRIIPNERGVGRSRLESLLSTGPSNESTAADAASDPVTTGWKSYMPPEPRPQSGSDVLAPNAPRDAATEPGNENSRAQGRARTDSLVESGETSQSRRNQLARPSQPVDEKGPEPKPVFDLGALLKDPEFREIHTRPVLDALELLAQHETRHRLLGALRIGVLGSDARTALPALRQFLGEEPSQVVRLRVAEGILKLQPNDRAALETLSRSLIDPNDAELRQAAAGALGGAAAAGNPTAIVRLTDALDDPVPKVRIMAALSLAQFGPAAIDAIPRLELAASNDVPRMQRAALAALASIRAIPGSRDSESAPSPVVDSQTTLAPPTFRSTNNVALPAMNLDGDGPRSTFADRESPTNRAGSPPAAFPDLKEAPASIHTFELKGTAEGSGRAQLWQTIPARGISLHEIASDGANAEARLHHSAEPTRLPDVPARPLDRAGEPTIRSATEAPKAAITPAPLSNDSPLNLEPQSGASKPGSSQ
jgi:hypothetical protein